MSRYDIYLFLHILSAAIWVGGGIMLSIQTLRAERARDEASLKKIIADNAVLGGLVFVPASFSALIWGVLMVVDGPWSFSELWIGIGIAGYLATALIGMTQLKPRWESLLKRLPDSGLTPTLMADLRKVVWVNRADTAVLIVVIADMALKPTVNDVAVLAVMAAVIVAAAGYLALRLRSIGASRLPAA